MRLFFYFRLCIHISCFSPISASLLICGYVSYGLTLLDKLFRYRIKASKVKGIVSRIKISYLTAKINLCTIQIYFIK